MVKKPKKVSLEFLRDCVVMTSWNEKTRTDSELIRFVNVKFFVICYNKD